MFTARGKVCVCVCVCCLKYSAIDCNTLLKVVHYYTTVLLYFVFFFLASDFIGDNRIELIIQKLLVQMTFSGENFYVGHTSKKNNL